MDKIIVLSAKGEGRTKVNAFDKALADINLHNFNLITVSSIIPPGVEVSKMDAYLPSNKQVGDRLYITKACCICTQPGVVISAGIGWAQAKEGGIFFEIEGEFPISICQEEIKLGLAEMMDYRKWNWIDKIKMETISHTVEKVGCVLVVAVYDYL